MNSFTLHYYVCDATRKSQIINIESDLDITYRIFLQHSDYVIDSSGSQLLVK